MSSSALFSLMINYLILHLLFIVYALNTLSLIHIFMAGISHITGFAQ